MPYAVELRIHNYVYWGCFQGFQNRNADEQLLGGNIIILGGMCIY